MSARPASWFAWALAPLLVLGLAACGSGADDTRACTEIRQVFTDLSQKGVQEVADPAAMEQTYRDAAATIRRKAENADGDVRAAATEVADEVEKLGHGIAALADNPSTVPQLPDVAALTAAGQALQQACS
jgi:predicted outer membrane protein